MLKQRRLLDREKGEHALGDKALYAPFGRRRPRWKLKGCPNCGGDLYREGDEYTCLRCGRKQW